MDFILAAGLSDFSNSLFGHINGIVSSVFFFNILFFVDGARLPLAVAWLTIASIYLTFKMRFVNLRYFGHAVALTLGKYDNSKSKGEVSHFAALTTALSATVGLGNIAGVTIAIAKGGPGATLWIVVAGLLGMSAKFAECTLAQMYRTTESDGHILGGPMLYLERGFREKGFARVGKFLAILFAVLCMFGSMGGAGSFQVNQSMSAVGEVFPFFIEHKWVYGLIMASMVAMVIIGGLKRIATTAEKIVPFMFALFVMMALYILAVNVTSIPSAFIKIVDGAFNADALYGGFLGVLVIGFQRAAFSNEAGMGSSAIAHSAARAEHPVQEGIVALLEPFIDTVVLCTITALVIVISGAYNNPDYLDLIHSNQGSALTSRAVGQAHWIFPYLLAVICFLFAYSTIISWSYYGERAFVYLFGLRFSLLFKLVLVVVLFLGAVTTATQVMEFGDLIILGMGFPNLLGVYLLREKVLASLREYGELLRSGVIRRPR